jgi:hypothetical protein
MAQHRADPSCTGCHLSMDPIGLGMEEFDGIGARRANPPDLSGELPDGRQFTGVAELQTIIAEDPRLASCFVEQILIHALARAPRPLDACHHDQLTAEFGASCQRVRSLFHAVAASRVFTHQRLPGEDEP